jgi:hypothetical protein
MTLHINDNGIWKTNDPNVNDGGIVKPVNAGYVNENGIWKEMYTSVTPPTVIGEFIQGGYYFGELQGYHLICYKNEGNLRWKLKNTDTPGTDDWYDGAANTQNAAIDATNYAAKACWDMNVNGYSDWYLPAYWELRLLFQQKVELDAAGAVFIEDVYYWSSTQNPQDVRLAYCCFSTDGSISAIYKRFNHYYKAIRRWTP